MRFITGLIIGLIIIILIGAVNVYAYEFDNTLSITKTDRAYPDLTIKNMFGLGGDLAKLELLENNECFINCYAIINITLFNNDVLPVNFETTNGAGKPVSKTFKYFILVRDSYDITIPHYKAECTPRIVANGTYDECNYVNDYNETKEIITYDWKKYFGETLKAGTYTYKIETNKAPYEKIDWTFSYMGISASSIKQAWAWWDLTYTKKKAVTLNGVVTANSTVLLKITRPDAMSETYNDLRFANNAESAELPYYIEWSNATYANVSVRITDNSTFYMYYSNPSATTNVSNFTLTKYDLYENISSLMPTGPQADSEFKGMQTKALYNLTITKMILYTSNALRCQIATTGGANLKNHTAVENFNGLYAYTFNYDIVQGTEYIFACNENGMRYDSVAWSFTEGLRTNVNFTQQIYSMSINNGGHRTLKGVDSIKRFTAGYTIGAETSLNGLVVTLNNPPASYVSNSSTVIFNCTSSDETGVLNLTLLIDGLENTTVTNSTAGENLSIYSTKTLSEGAHNWTCRASDGTGEGDPYTPSVRTIFIDNTAPALNITAPANNSEYQFFGSTVNNISMNYSIVETNIGTCWFNDGIVNRTITCGNNISVAGAPGFHTFTLYANDTVNNIASKSITLLVNYITSVTYNFTKTVTEHQINKHYLNITATNITTINATINYNGNLTNMTLDSNNGTLARLSVSVTSPTIDSDTSIVVFYNYTLNGITRGTNSSNQTVYNIGNLTVNCTTPSLLFVLYDEETLLNITGTYDFNFKYGTTNNTEVTTFGTFSGITLPICINTTVSPNYSIGYGEIKYESTGYSPRRYYVFENTVINNQTQTINLYDITTATQTSFKLEIESTSLDPYENIYASLIRWYPDLNEYKTVDMGKTDEQGSTVVHVKTEDIDYRIGVYEVNGTLIKLANPIRMVCLATPCTYTLKISPTDEDYTSFLGITYDFDFNETLGIWTFTYSDTSLKTSTMNLTIWKDTGTNSFVICSSQTTGASGAITCNTSEYTGTLRAEVTRSASPGVIIAQKIVSVITATFKSSFGLWLTLLLAIPIIFTLVLISPIGAIIGGVIALIPALYLGSINIGIVGGFAVLGGLVAHFLKRVS